MYASSRHDSLVSVGFTVSKLLALYAVDDIGRFVLVVGHFVPVHGIRSVH